MITNRPKTKAYKRSVYEMNKENKNALVHNGMTSGDGRHERNDEVYRGAEQQKTNDKFHAKHAHKSSTSK